MLRIHLSIVCSLLLALILQQSGVAQERSIHYIYGHPIPKDTRHEFYPPGKNFTVEGLTILERPGFVIGHYDEYKQPAWMSMRWTRKNLREIGVSGEHERDYQPDEDLPPYARGDKGFNTNRTHMQQGHMACQKDNTAWGPRNVAFGNRRSNLCPQHEDLNPKEWRVLENRHRTVVREGSPVDKVWIISGPIFDSNFPVRYVANQIRIPSAFYKIVAWYDTDREFHATGYIYPNKVEKRSLSAARVAISEIEDRTGLEFFPGLDPDKRDEIRNVVHAGLWSR